MRAPLHWHHLVLATLTIFMHAPSPGAEPDPKDWFPFQADQPAAPSPISLNNWIEKPAGAHGRIVRKGDQLLCNGRPIKLWGLNLCYAAGTAPEKATADARAALYAKFGVNTVRLHKYADGPGWAGIQSERSAAEFDPEALDRFDYQVAQFKKAGIYLKLSAAFGTLKLGPDDERDVPYLAEFGTFDFDHPEKKVKRIGGGNSLFSYSPEIQNVHLRQITNLLSHTNPYTGLTYAEDPAIAFVEIVNECSILFFTSMNPLRESKTLRAHIGRTFCNWLRERYKTHDALTKAWGKKALNSFRDEGFTADEHLDKDTILPLGNPWFWDPAQLAGSQAFRKQRLLDSLAFLYTLQNEAYARWTKAVRAAGYSGELVASNWQAGRAFSHYANLHSDAMVGIIDRHNYFGGQRDKVINTTSMLAQAGSGMLSSGAQQVADRPFMLSEWIHVFPTEWTAEGPALIGAYGMGLQDWDVSYMFQNQDSGGFSHLIGRDRWDVTAPPILGLFPAIARQIYRGDVQPSPLTAVRKVHVPSLFEGQLNLDEGIEQGYDEKSFKSKEIPESALAVARCVVDFTEKPESTQPFPIEKHRSQGALRPPTQQLAWFEGKAQTPSGYFTMDTPGTQALVGFASEKTADLKDSALTSHVPFAALYLTAQERDASLATSSNLLLFAFARARNTGMDLGKNDDQLIEKGEAPIRLEPVRATVRIKRAEPFEVIPLDHNGRETDARLSIKKQSFEIDGSRDKTPFYWIRFPATNAPATNAPSLTDP